MELLEIEYHFCRLWLNIDHKTLGRIIGVPAFVSREVLGNQQRTFFYILRLQHIHVDTRLLTRHYCDNISECTFCRKGLKEGFYYSAYYPAASTEVVRFCLHIGPQNTSPIYTCKDNSRRDLVAYIVVVSLSQSRKTIWNSRTSSKRWIGRRFLLFLDSGGLVETSRFLLNLFSQLYFYTRTLAYTHTPITRPNISCCCITEPLRRCFCNKKQIKVKRAWPTKPGGIYSKSETSSFSKLHSSRKHDRREFRILKLKWSVYLSYPRYHSLVLLPSSWSTLSPLRVCARPWGHLEPISVFSGVSYLLFCCARYCQIHARREIGANEQIDHLERIVSSVFLFSSAYEPRSIPTRD